MNSFACESSYVRHLCDGWQTCVRAVYVPPQTSRELRGSRLCEVIYLLFLQDKDVRVDCNSSACHRRQQRERKIDGSASVTMTNGGRLENKCCREAAFVSGLRSSQTRLSNKTARYLTHFGCVSIFLRHIHCLFLFFLKMFAVSEWFVVGLSKNPLSLHQPECLHHHNNRIPGWFVESSNLSGNQHQITWFINSYLIIKILINTRGYACLPVN